MSDFVRMPITIGLACLWLSSATPVGAQDYPAKPIRFVVAYAAGGTADIMARIIAASLTEALKQQVIVDNRPGAGGNIGTEIVARAPADGYTLTAGSSNTHGTNASLYKVMPYDPVKDFAPITLAVIVSTVLVATPALPVGSVSDLVALGRRRPGELKFASAGIGSTPHIAGELFKMMTKTTLTHVPYKGGAPALIDVVGGQVELMFAGLAPTLPYVRAGRLKALAVAEKIRSRVLPELPTVAESGVPGFDVKYWIGVMAPAGTPQPIVARLNREIVAVLRDPQVNERLAQQGLEPVGDTPAEFAAIVKSDLAKWAMVFREAGIRPE